MSFSHRRAGRVAAAGTAALAALATVTATASAAPGSNSVGPSTTTKPYLVRATPGVTFTSILTAGDATGGYQFAGTPDGLGAWDNGDGTFTLLVGHEFQSSDGVVRAHGATGSFVSVHTIEKASLRVLSSEDLDTTFVTAGDLAMARLCSADLPPRSAFFNAATGNGYDGHIFMNGEENGPPFGDAGRAIAHVVETRTAYDLPALGRASWENVVAHPDAGDDTVVVGQSDGGTAYGTSGEVFVYHGTKTSSGSPVDKAGLTNGTSMTVAVDGLAVESGTVDYPGAMDFSLAAPGSGTQFYRPEDGAWDTKDPNVYYFNTTARFGQTSRIWKLTFVDATHPELGGTAEVLLKGGGASNQGPQMLDNITVNDRGQLISLEDVGGNDYVGGGYQVDPSTGAYRKIFTFDPAQFTPGAPGFITNDEESSGVIPAPFLGEGKYLITAQVHEDYTGPGAEAVVEMGQVMLMRVPAGQKIG
jgi:hypothetical protein